MRSPLVDALLNPFNLVMLALAVAAGLCAAWWLFPLGVGLWILMVVNIANDKSLRINYDMQARLGTLSTRFQGLYAKVVRTQVRIFNTLNTADGRTRQALTPIYDEIEILTNQVYTLCQRMTAPENYVKVSRANSDLEGERALLVLALDGQTDPVVKREKEEALHALDKRMQQFKNVETLLNRVEAQTTSIVSVLEGVLAEIIRLQALGSRQAAQQTAPVLEQIRAQVAQLKQFEEEAGQAI